MLILQKIANGIRNFGIPHMHPKKVHVQAGKVINILSDRFFMRNPHPHGHPKRMRKGDGIIDTEAMDFRTVVTPSQYTFPIHKGVAIFLSKERKKSETIPKQNQ
jgi:hypothetical protein